MPKDDTFAGLTRTEGFTAMATDGADLIAFQFAFSAGVAMNGEVSWVDLG